MFESAKEISTSDFSSAVARKAVEATGDFNERLRALAELIAALPAIRGAMVIALDKEEKPIASGAYNLPLPLPGNQSHAETLVEITDQFRSQLKRSRWFSICSSVIEATEATSVLALSILIAERRSGLLIVDHLKESKEARSTLTALKRKQEILAWAIEDAVRGGAFERVEKLQRLAINIMTQPKPDLQKLVRNLAELFQAEAVTILRRDQKELRLAASTDENLGKDTTVIYRAGMGLTGYVFQTGNSLRLDNCNDAEAVRHLTGLKRPGPIHPERCCDGSYMTQFLAVAMHCGESVEGVLRMSRRKGVAQFTHQDEHALQFFGDLLGSLFARLWALFIANSIMETSSEAIIVSKREAGEREEVISKIVFANPGATQLLGIAQTQIQGIETRDIYEPKAYDRTCAYLNEALKNEEKSIGPILSRLKKADGTLRSAKVSYRILTNHLVCPPTIYTIDIARDTTEGELQAAQHRRLLEMLAELGLAYYRADHEGFTVESTVAESAITGYAQEELFSINRKDLFCDPDDHQIFFKKARGNRGRPLRVRQKLKRKDGTLFWAEGDLRILRDENGQEIGIEGLYQDVTDRLHLQGFLNAATDRILLDHELFEKLWENAAFHLDYMTSLGHQLQTPLSSLVENLRNFERGILDGRKITDRLPYVIGQAVVCTRLVRNLSYMDKVLRGEPFQRRCVHLSKLTLETKSDFLHLLKERNIDLYIDKESLQRHLAIQGHREMLRQVVVNLVDNAIKYSLPQSKIRICAHHWPQGRIFDITNRGLPIPEELREKIFERGFRTNRAKMTIPHGTGLGLWLIRKIVEAHGASIHCQEVIENNERLTLFRIVFPHKSANTRRTA